MMNNSHVTKYLKDIKSLFPTFQKEDKLFFKKFEQTVKKETNYLTMTYQDCIEKFGDPKEILFVYYEEMDSADLLKRIRNQHIFRKIFFILIIAILFVSLVACGLLYKSFLDVREGHVTNTETITEIIE